MSDYNTMVIPVPQVAPFGLELTKGGVQDVWDTFVKPLQESGTQSSEDRCLMAILRAVYKGYCDLESDVVE